MAIMATTAKASLTSHRSTSSTRPAGLLQRLLHRRDRGGGEQARLMGMGRMADDAGDDGQAQAPCATLSRVITRAAAPSVIEEALAAVIVPSLAKAGFRSGSSPASALQRLFVLARP